MSRNTRQLQSLRAFYFLEVVEKQNQWLEGRGESIFWSLTGLSTLNCWDIQGNFKKENLDQNRSKVKQRGACLIGFFLCPQSNNKKLYSFKLSKDTCIYLEFYCITKHHVHTNNNNSLHFWVFTFHTLVFLVVYYLFHDSDSTRNIIIGELENLKSTVSFTV